MQNKISNQCEIQLKLRDCGILYFSLNLLSYLLDSHPDKAGDLSFIAGHGDLAAECYSDAIKSG